ncbi:multicopper oxidase family protein [Nitrosarchaeum koreense]|nr:multicopper oxidase family protein [Nitrosarchaeum koreense]
MNYNIKNNFNKFHVILIMFILFSGIIFLGSFDDVNALKSKGDKGLSPKSFGKVNNNIVCGDKLCIDIFSKNTFEKDFQKTSMKLLSTVPSISISNNEIFDLSASKITKVVDGKSLQMYGYNGQTPGPLLLVTQGDEISVTFKNNLDVPTTVHWHGLRLDIANDGVPGITQEPILPGDTFVYQLRFPDSGIFLYHPHVRTEMQMELGLYGNILVEPKVQNIPTIDYQIPLILDDISLTKQGIQEFDPDIVTNTLMGRFGNTMLINGETNYSLQLTQGDVVRFYLTNTANTRTFDFGIEEQKIKLVADDASNYEREEIINSVILSPSERRTIDVLFENSGTFDIIHSTPEKTYVMGKIKVYPSNMKGDSDFYNTKENLDIIQEMDSFRKFFSDAPDLELEFDVKTMSMDTNDSIFNSQSMKMLPHEKELAPIEWEDELPQMNAISNEENTRWVLRDTATGKEGFDINYQVNVGDVKKIRLINSSESSHPMQHPIHLHGQRFLVLAEDGVQNENLAWKDSVLVPAGKTVDILVEFSNIGVWAMHCHILEHAESGMITDVTVN